MGQTDKPGVPVSLSGLGQVFLEGFKCGGKPQAGWYGYADRGLPLAEVIPLHDSQVFGALAQVAVLRILAVQFDGQAQVVDRIGVA
jgi:hypothetical protein